MIHKEKRIHVFVVKWAFETPTPQCRSGYVLTSLNGRSEKYPGQSAPFALG